MVTRTQWAELLCKIFAIFYKNEALELLISRSIQDLVFFICRLKELFAKTEIVVLKITRNYYKISQNYFVDITRNYVVISRN